MFFLACEKKLWPDIISFFGPRLKKFADPCRRPHWCFMNICSVIVDKAKSCFFTLTRSAEKMNTVRLNHCFVTIVILRCVSVPVTSMQILVSDNIGENVSNSTPKDAPIFYTNRGVNFRCVARGGYPEPEVRVLIGSRRIGSLYNMPSSVQTKRLPRRYQYSKLYCLVTCFFLLRRFFPPNILYLLGLWLRLECSLDCLSAPTYRYIAPRMIHVWPCRARSSAPRHRLWLCVGCGCAQAIHIRYAYCSEAYNMPMAISDRLTLHDVITSGQRDNQALWRYGNL